MYKCNPILHTEEVVSFYAFGVQVSKFLRGEVGVLFTNKTKDEVYE